MFDLQALALRLGHHARVRVQAGPRRLEPRLSRRAASTPAFHTASHHSEREDRILDFAKINTYHVSLVPYLLEKLKNTPDGDGNLLDNSLIVYGSPMGNSNVHNHKRCPLFLAGHAGGALKGNCTSRPPTARRWPTRCSPWLHTLGLDDDAASATARATLDLNAVAPVTTVEGTESHGALQLLHRPGRRCQRSLPSDAPSRRRCCRRGQRAGRRRGDAGQHGQRCARCSSRRADVNAAQGDGMTALHWAAMKGDADLAQLLLVRRRQRARDDAARRLHAAASSPPERQRRGDRAAAEGRAPTSTPRPRTAPRR